MAFALELALYNIRSVHNVGSLFRTAESVGAKAVHLIGYTPAPEDRFGRMRADMHKSALGAEELVPWHVWKDEEEFFAHMRSEGSRTIAVEQSSESVIYTKLELFPISHVYILGNETEGLPISVIEKADACIELPMLGKKESLNVAVAGGIVLYDARMRWREMG